MVPSACPREVVLTDGHTIHSTVLPVRIRSEPKEEGQTTRLFRRARDMLLPSLLLNGRRDDSILRGGTSMETRVAVLAVIVREGSSVQTLNDLLHQYGQYIIGRMGVPYREKGVNIISVAMDAPGDVISALSGKLGRLEGVTAKTVYAPAGSV